MAWIALVAATVVLLLSVRPDPAPVGEPLSASSTSAEGARGLALLLRSYGAEVRIAEEPGEGDVALVLEDDLSESQIADLDRFARGGGVVVVASPFSPLLDLRVEPGGPSGIFGEEAETMPSGRCTMKELEGLELQPSPVSLFFDLDQLPEGARYCFGSEDSAFLVELRRGEGSVVALGSPWIFSNGQLGSFDHSVLAVYLVAPRDGTRVAWVRAGSAAVEAGARSLWDLVSPGSKAALAQLAVAVALYVAYRARRLGRPMSEPLPVKIAGSELVEAVGQLLRQQRSPDRAARLIRADLRRALGNHLGLGPGAAPEALIEVVLSRSPQDPERARWVLGDSPVRDDAELVQLARGAARLTHEIVYGPWSASGAGMASAAGVADRSQRAGA